MVAPDEEHVLRQQPLEREQQRQHLHAPGAAVHKVPVEHKHAAATGRTKQLQQPAQVVVLPVRVAHHRHALLAGLRAQLWVCRWAWMDGVLSAQRERGAWAQHTSPAPPNRAPSAAWAPV
jgi:hypothetical protein